MADVRWFARCLVPFVLFAPAAAAQGFELDVGEIVGGAISLDAPLEVAIEVEPPILAPTKVDLAPDLALDLASAIDPSPAPGSRAPRVVDVAAPAAAATVGAWILLKPLAIALYSRLKPHQLLDNEHRERVVALVRAQPGVGPTDVARAVGCGWGTAIYHLERLERAGLVTSQRSGHHRCYYAPGVQADARPQFAAMRAPATRQLAQHVLRSPGRTQTEICAELGLSRSAASKQVKHLEAARLVRREGSPRGARLYPEPALADTLR